jgi:dihydropteroate synthase
VVDKWAPSWGSRTYVMGIVNLTPDSFSGDGIYGQPLAAAEKASNLVGDGADIIDLGGESTRPGHVAIDLAEELSRVMPSLRSIAKRVDVPISIDTTKVEVARRTLDCGATVINDVSGLRDPRIAEEVASKSAWLILVHNGSPGRAANPMEGVLEDLANRIDRAVQRGVRKSRIRVDPGLGIGKGWRENLEMLRRLPELRALGRPVVVGPSRKGMIGRVLGVQQGERMAGSAALVAVSSACGADVVRVHDVREMARVSRVVDTLVRPLQMA